jgi:hypothetical protein
MESKIEIIITIKDGMADVVSNIEHDDVVMYYLIESIYNLRNKQYSEFFNEDNKNKP